MNHLTRNVFRQTVVALGVAAFLPANAAIITGYGVDSVIKQYAIDGSASSVTHEPGFTFDDQVARTYAVSGVFEANFARYWWSYFLDGDIQGDKGTFIFEQNWLTFSNADIVGNISPSGFNLPSYFMSVNGSELSGDNGPCNFPKDPNTSCTGFSDGNLASMRGELGNGSIWIRGFVPIADGALFEGFKYDIKANAVPEPAMPMLLLGGFFAFLIAKKKQKPNRRVVDLNSQ